MYKRTDPRATKINVAKFYPILLNKLIEPIPRVYKKAGALDCVALALIIPNLINIGAVFTS